MRKSPWIDPPYLEPALTVKQYLEIASHPAFRIGLLDAQAGRPFDEDNIFARIRNETPAEALKPHQWMLETEIPARDMLGALPPLDWHHHSRVALAQIRYEEGRIAHVRDRVRCHLWTNPNEPPREILRWAATRATRIEAEPELAPLPLFEAAS